MKNEIPILFSTDMVKAIIDKRKTKTRRTRFLSNIDLNATKVVWSDSWPKEGDWIARFSIGGDPERFEVTDVIRCPYGKIGDVLWVREKARMVGWHFEDGEVTIGYADNAKVQFDLNDDSSYDWTVKQFEKLLDRDIIAQLSSPEGVDEDEIPFEFVPGKQQPWIPSIHMPKFIARIWLEITDIRVERLNDITPDDAGDEGVEYENVDADALQGGELQADFKNYMWRDDESYEDYHFPYYANCISSYKSLWEKINGEGSWKANPWVWVISFKVLSTEGVPEEFKSAAS